MEQQPSLLSSTDQTYRNKRNADKRQSNANLKKRTADKLKNQEQQIKELTLSLAEARRSAQLDLETAEIRSREAMTEALQQRTSQHKQTMTELTKRLTAPKHV